MSYCLLTVTKFFYQVFYRQPFYFTLLRQLSAFQYYYYHYYYCCYCYYYYYYYFQFTTFFLVTASRKKDTVEQFYRRAEDKVTCVLLGICFPFFSILVLLYFCLATLLQHRMLGDNVLGGGGMWWCRLDDAQCLGIFLYLQSLQLFSFFSSYLTSYLTDLLEYILFFSSY